MSNKLENRFYLILNHLIEFPLFSFGISVFLQIILYFLGFQLSLYPFFISFILYPIYRSFIEKKFKLDWTILFTFTLLGLISIGLTRYFMMFIEHSFDGNMYHGEAMVQMIRGWNPVYNLNNYASSIGYEWAVLYPKFTWIYSAFWIKLTGISSTGMLLNAFIGIITTIKVYIYVSRKTKSFFISVLVSFIVICNPIFIEQIHTFYVDALMSNLLLLLILYNLELAEEFNLNRLFYISLISILIINIKFTGFAFAGLIDLATFSYFVIKHKDLAIKYFIAGIVIILVGVGVIGYSPYLVNILNSRNIFYPLMGENKWDIISYMIPEPMLNLRSYERLLYSLSMGKPYLENLFTIKEHGYLFYDQRIGGFGGEFFKLILLSIIIIGTFIFTKFKKIKLYEAFMFILFGLTILINFRNIWWARYAPQLWYLIPLGIIILLSSKTHNFIKYPLSLFMFFLVIFQSQDIYKHTFERDQFITQEAIDVYNSLKEKTNLKYFVNGGVLNQFSVFEEYKAREYGLDIEEIIYDTPNTPYECYRLDNYEVCILIENELD